MLAESQHISYLFDKAYDDIYRYIFRIIRSEALIRKLTGQTIYTGYYYDTEGLCCRFKEKYTSDDAGYPIFIHFNPDYKSHTLMAAEENDGHRVIVLHVFLNNIIELRTGYMTMKDSAGMYYDLSQSDGMFREEMMGHISHEFVHIRQMFCGTDYDRATGTRTHIDGNPIQRQIENKSKYERAVDELPGINDECRDMLRRCFYLFTRTEMDARINASLRHYDSEQKMRELADDYAEEKKQRATSDGEQPEDPYDRMMLDLCIRKTYMFNDLDDMEQCLDYMRHHEYAYHLLKEIDNHEGLHFFRHGLENAMKHYKARLYKGFYKLLRKYGYRSSDGILEALVAVSPPESDLFLSMTCEHADSLGRPCCR